MVKWKGQTSDGRMAIGICLTTSDIERLRAGETAMIDGAAFDLPRAEIFIEFAATDGLALERLREQGIFAEHSGVKFDPAVEARRH